MRATVLAACFACVLANHANGQDALRGKRVYHDGGRLNGTGISCVDCHGGVPGGLHGIAKAADNPQAIDRRASSCPEVTSGPFVLKSTAQPSREALGTLHNAHLALRAWLLG